MRSHSHPSLRAGTLFRYKGQQYRLDGFLREMPQQEPALGFLETLLAEIAAESQRPGRLRLRLRWCLPEQATYLSGSGVCGCVAPISEVEVVGVVSWSKQALTAHHLAAVRRGQLGEFAEAIEFTVEVQP